MNNRRRPEQFLQNLDTMAKRYEEIVGQPFHSENHKKKGKRSPLTGVIRKLCKEFKLKNPSNVRDYLKLWELPEYAKTAIKQGTPWKQFFQAIHAPEDIRKLTVQKVANNEFKNATEVKEFIKGPKPMQVQKGEPMEEPKSKAEQIRDAFRITGTVNVEEYAKKLYGEVNEQNILKVKSVVYSAARSVEIELQKSVVYKDGTYVLEDQSIEPPKNTQMPSNEPIISGEKVRSKTAVFVIREIRQNGNTRYELDAVGDFNRGMIKEALKQLMEVYI